MTAHWPTRLRKLRGHRPRLQQRRRRCLVHRCSLHRSCYCCGLAGAHGSGAFPSSASTSRFAGLGAAAPAPTPAPRPPSPAGPPVTAMYCFPSRANEIGGPICDVPRSKSKIFSPVSARKASNRLLTLEKTRLPAVDRLPPANGPAPPPGARHRSLRATGSQAYRTLPVGPSGPMTGRGRAGSAGAAAGAPPVCAFATATAPGSSGAAAGAFAPLPRPPPPPPVPVPMFMRPLPVGPISVGCGTKFGSAR